MDMDVRIGWIEYVSMEFIRVSGVLMVDNWQTMA